MALTLNTRTTNSTDSRNSRYVQGGTTDRYQNRLGWWERRIIPQAYDDIVILVKNGEANRPDLIAYRTYQDVTLSWLVLEYNNIIDPVIELTAGRQIRLPSQKRLTLSILTTPIGGNRINGDG